VEDNRKPDPTTLTTDALLREIGHLEKQISTRLDAMDRAVDVFKADLVRFPTELDRRLIQLKELTDEKIEGIGIQFDGVEKRFLERDIRVNQSTESGKVALAAALAAQKEASSDHITSLSLAIGKSEQHTITQLEQQRTVLISVEKTLSDKITDVSDRMNRWEGVGSGKGLISTPLWAMAASVLTALMIAGVLMLFDNPDSKQPSINADNIAAINRRLDAIEQILQRGSVK
jgi:hypothetical protein